MKIFTIWIQLCANLLPPILFQLEYYVCFVICFIVSCKPFHSLSLRYDVHEIEIILNSKSALTPHSTLQWKKNERKKHKNISKLNDSQSNENDRICQTITDESCCVLIKLMRTLLRIFNWYSFYGPRISMKSKMIPIILRANICCWQNITIFRFDWQNSMLMIQLLAAVAMHFQIFAEFNL